MGVFRDTGHFYACVGELMDRAKKDPAIGPKIAKSGNIIQFRYSDPEALTTMDARGKPTQPGAFCGVRVIQSDLTNSGVRCIVSTPAKLLSLTPSAFQTRDSPLR